LTRDKKRSKRTIRKDLSNMLKDWLKLERRSMRSKRKLKMMLIDSSRLRRKLRNQVTSRLL